MSWYYRRTDWREGSKEAEARLEALVFFADASCLSFSHLFALQNPRFKIGWLTMNIEPMSRDIRHKNHKIVHVYCSVNPELWPYGMRWLLGSQEPTRSAERDQHAQQQALLLEFSKQQSCDAVDGNCAGEKAIQNRKKPRGLRGDCLELLRYPRLKWKKMKDKTNSR